MFSNEDVTIGAWMLAMNVNHENSRELCAPECTSTSIAVWDIPKCSGSYFSIFSEAFNCIITSESYSTSFQSKTLIHCQN